MRGRPVAVKTYPVSPWRPVPVPRLRIALVADLHACRPFMPPARIAAIVEQVNGLAPDLICLLGDYAGHAWGSRTVAPAEVVPELLGLSAPLGVFAVFGNHDWKDDPEASTHRVTHWHRAFAEAGIATLNNRATVIETAQGSFTLAGLDSQRAFRKRFSRATTGADDLDAVLPALDPERFTLLMAHEPDIFARLPDHVDLTVSGHTHGGQIRPFGRAMLVPSAFGTRYAYGHITKGQRQLVVSGGLGLSGLPLRWNMPPEVTLVAVS